MPFTEQPAVCPIGCKTACSNVYPDVLEFPGSLVDTSIMKVSKIMAGSSGHEYEVVVRFQEYSLDNYIPFFVEKKLRNALPENWLVENRGSRIEVRQLDNFKVYGAEEEAVVRKACLAAGFEVLA